MLPLEAGGQPADCASPEFTQAGQALRRVHEVMLDGHDRASPDVSWAAALTACAGGHKGRG
jgi:hypothetical protein